MNWNCTKTEERLSDVLDGALPPEEQAACSAHSAACARCTGLVAEVGGLVVQLRQIPLVEEPPFLASKIIAVTHQATAQEADARRWFAWLPRIWQMRFAMGVATVIASFFIVFHAVGTPRGIALSPVSLYQNANRHVHLTYARGVKFVNDLRVVYVIQSRLASEPEPTTEPVSQPESKPEQHPPDSNARPIPRPSPDTNRKTADIRELAILVVGGGPGTSWRGSLRSFP